MLAVMASEGSWVWDILGLLAVPALVALNGFFVAAEFALVAVRRTRVEELVKEGVEGARAVESALAKLDRSIAATQLGITLASIALGFLGEPALEKLLEQARSVDRNSPGDLAGFITQLSEFVTQAPKEALAATQSEGGDVIRIMTIHYAKGLEFPLVVLPDLERARHRGRSEPVLDPDLGPLVPLKDSDGALGFGGHGW